MVVTTQFWRRSEDKVRASMKFLAPTPSNKNAHAQLYLTITISQPKIRIRIPKFMAKRIERRRRCRSGCDGHEETKMMEEEKRVEEICHEKEKVRTLSSSAVNCTGSTVQSEEFKLDREDGCEAENQEDNDQEYEDDEEEKVAQRDKKSKFGNHLARKVRSLFSRVVGWKNVARERKIGSQRPQTKTRREHTVKTNQHDEKQTQQDEIEESEHENTSMESYLFKKCWYEKEEELGRRITCKLSKKSSSYPSFFHRRARWASLASTSSSCSSDCINGRRSSTKLSRIPARGLSSAIKFKMFKSLFKKKMVNQIEGDLGSTRKDDESFELCKKRILMGGRCRPLSFSGTLRYDKDGVLLPEMFPC